MNPWEPKRVLNLRDLLGVPKTAMREPNRKERRARASAMPKPPPTPPDPMKRPCLICRSGGMHSPQMHLDYLRDEDAGHFKKMGLR